LRNAKLTEPGLFSSWGIGSRFKSGYSEAETIYDPSGRYPVGKEALPQALRKATHHYEDLCMVESKHSNNRDLNHRKLPQFKYLAAATLANAQLAADVSIEENKKAYRLLLDSIKALKASGYEKQKSLSPQYIHGLYNLGTFALNHDLREMTQKLWGANVLADGDKNFEGLTLNFKSGENAPLYQKLQSGLDYLDQAILLTDKLPEPHLAKAEYQVIKGEVLHAMAHLSPRGKRKNPNRAAHYRHSQEARDAFEAARHTLESAPVEVKRTAQYKELKKQLTDVKIPHLCSPKHRDPEEGYIPTVCAAPKLGVEQRSLLPNIFSSVSN